MLPICPILILSLLFGLLNFATSAPATSNDININSIEDDNYCQLSFYKTSYPRSDYVMESVNNTMNEKIQIRGAKSYQVSTSPKAHCCWIFKKRKNGRHWIRKIEKKPGENTLYYKQFYKKKGYWVTVC